MATTKKFQYCGLCKNHDILTPKKGHTCGFRECECLLCDLTRRTQKAMRYQQRFWRFQKVKQRHSYTEPSSSSSFPTSSHENAGTSNAGCSETEKKIKVQQLCDKCRNHSILIPKKNHVCPNSNCTCKFCSITLKRRELMKYQQRIRRSNVITSVNGNGSDDQDKINEGIGFDDEQNSMSEFCFSSSNKEDETEVEEFYETRLEKDNDSLQETQDFLQKIDSIKNKNSSIGDNYSILPSTHSPILPSAHSSFSSSASSSLHSCSFSTKSLSPPFGLPSFGPSTSHSNPNTFYRSPPSCSPPEFGISKYSKCFSDSSSTYPNSSSPTHSSFPRSSSPPPLIPLVQCMPSTSYLTPPEHRRRNFRLPQHDHYQSKEEE